MHTIITTYVLQRRNKDADLDLPSSLKWVEELACIREQTNTNTVQACAVLLNKFIVMWKLHEIGFQFGVTDAHLAIAKHKNESLRFIIHSKMIEKEDTQRWFEDCLEKTGADAVNLEGLTLLVDHHKPTRERLVLSGFYRLITHININVVSDQELYKFFRHVRDTISLDIQHVFIGAAHSKNFEAFKALDTPEVNYAYANHIDFSWSMEVYNYFLSRGLTPSTRLFVHTTSLELVEFLLVSGMRPTEVDILHTVTNDQIEKLHLYHQHGIKFNTSYLKFTLNDDIIDYLNSVIDKNEGPGIDWAEEYYDDDIIDDVQLQDELEEAAAAAVAAGLFEI